MNLKSESGQSSIVTYFFFLVGVVGLSYSVIHLGRNATWQTKERMATAATQLARAGLNQGFLWFKEDPDHWAETAATNQTIPISPIEDQASNTSLSIVVGPGANADERWVTATGRADWPKSSMGSEIRELRAVLKKVEGDGGTSNVTWSPIIINGDATLGGNLEAHWGPIVVMENLTLQGNALNKHYPRKFCRKKINGSLTGDDVELFPNRTDLQDIPPLNLEAFRQRALNQITDHPLDANWNGTAVAANLPQGTRIANTNVYQGTGAQNRVKFNNQVDAHPNDPTVDMPTTYDDRVRYVEGNLQLTGNIYLQGTLIVLGDLDIHGTGQGCYKAPVPTGASAEYAAIDTSAPSEYPGDLGSSSVNTVFKFCSGASALSDGNGDRVAINGLVYVTGDLHLNGNKVIHGSLWVRGDAVGNGTAAVYARNGISMVPPPTVTGSMNIKIKRIDSLR